MQKMNLVKEKGGLRQYGKYTNYIIKDQNIFMNYFTSRKKFLETFMNIALEKNGETQH